MENIIIQKTCNSCQKSLPTLQFTLNKAKPDGLANRCKNCDKVWRSENFNHLKLISQKYQNKTKDERKLKAKEYRQKNKAILTQKYKKYSQKHPEKARERGKRYRLSHPEKLRQQNQRWKNKQRKINPSFNLKEKLKTGFYDCLKRSDRKISKTFLYYLGCPPESLKLHLTSKFTEDMTWDKYLLSEIVVDHMIPFPCFDFNYDEDIHSYVNYKNLRPLWKDENNKKSAIDQKLGKIYKGLDRPTKLSLNKEIYDYINTNNPNYNQLKIFVEQILKNKLNIDVVFPEFVITLSPSYTAKHPNL